MKHGVTGRWFMVLAMTCPLPAQDATGPWQWAGFGTLGLAATDTRQAGFLRDFTQPKGIYEHPDARTDTRLGLQLNGRLGESLSCGVQFLTKYRYDGTFRPMLNAAYLAWNPTGNLELRAGRLNEEWNLTGDSRDVGYATTMVRPPVEFYARNAANKFHGLDLASTFPAGAGNLRLKAWGGFLAEEQMPLPGGAPANYTGTRMGGAIAEWQQGSLRVKLAWDFLHFTHKFPAKLQTLPDGLASLAVSLQEPKLAVAATALSMDGTRGESLNAAVAYEQGPWQAQAELSRTTANRVFLPDSWVGYALLAYRAGPLVPYGMFSRIVTHAPPALDLGILPSVPGVGPATVGYVKTFVDYLHNNQSTATVGLRWDFRAKADLKFQVDRVFANQTAGLWYQPQPGWNRRALVFSLTLDFVFGARH